MLDTYEEPDCAMEAAMVKVNKNFDDRHGSCFVFFSFSVFRLTHYVLLQSFSRSLAQRASGIAQANAYKFLGV